MRYSVWRLYTEMILLEDVPCERGLDRADALFGEVALAGVGGEDHQVDVVVHILLMERGVPAQMVRRDLVALRDLVDGSVDHGAPVLHVGVAQPLRVGAAQGDHRHPHDALVVCHLLHGLGEILHLAVGVPQAVVAIALDAGTVGDVVEEVLPLLQRHDILLP